MDVILTPTKLSGIIDARPSSVGTCLSDTARRIAHAGASAQKSGSPTQTKGLGPIVISDTQVAGSNLGPADMEAISQILDAVTLVSGKVPSDRADCKGNSLALTFTLPIAAALRNGFSFVGDIDMDESFLDPYTQLLSRHGVSFSCGDLKIKRRDRKKIREITTIRGRLQYGHYSLVGREDPWFLAGLLFSLPLLEGNSTIRMTTLPESSELADITVGILSRYGIRIDASVDDYGYPHYEIPGSQIYRMPEYADGNTTEPAAGIDQADADGDWTSAAFWLTCGALGGNVTVRGLNTDSAQSSRLVLDKLRTMGAAAGMGEGGANVTAVSLEGCNMSAGLIPDLIPYLAVAMASASGTSTLTDIGSFDPSRLIDVLNTLGANPFHEGSSLRFDGKAILTGGDVDPKGDPIAIMVAAAASCICSEAVLIRGAGAINKYYPDFFDEFEKLGGRIRVLP